MPTLPGGSVFEYKQVTVTKDDATVNAEITTQGADNWFVVQVHLDGANMIILFERIVAVQQPPP